MLQRFNRSFTRLIAGVGLATAVTLPLAALGPASTHVRAATRTCVPRAEALAASRASSLIAIDPRTSAAAASWGLDELARLMPYLAQAGLEVHVLYSQDGDDLGNGGGDGGQPQVLLTRAPGFPAFRVGGAPQLPSHPNPLIRQLYCNRLASWQWHAQMKLRAEGARRLMAVRAWARRTAAILVALARRRIPDTAGTEAGVEIDASASIFAAAEIAEAAPEPTIVFLGGLTALQPPARIFRLRGRLVALVRSSNPRQVLHAEAAWTRWADRAGGSFEALSADDAPATIGQMLASGRGSGPPRAVNTSTGPLVAQAALHSRKKG